jgi:predicted RNA-binding protein with TRAM domain
MEGPDDHVTTDDLLNRIDDLQATVNTELDDLRSTVEALPNGQKVSNVDDVLTVGTTYEAVIEDDGTNTKKGDPMGRIDGVATFIQNTDDQHLAVGDTVDVVISKTGERHAKGVVPQGDADA